MACRNVSKYVFTFNKRLRQLQLNFVRCKYDGIKVVLLDSYNKVGILTAYLLKKTNIFSEICLYETRNVPKILGWAEDLNNINCIPFVTARKGISSINRALENANIVVMLEKCDLVVKGCEKPECKTPIAVAGENLNAVFNANAEYCAKFAESYATACPSALLVVATRPVNSTVPLVCKIAECINHNVSVQKILGFMTLDIIAAQMVWAKSTKMKIENIKIPVVGGTTAHTTIPLFSQMKHPNLKPEGKEAEELNNELQKMTEKVRKMNELLLLNSKVPIATAAAIAKFIISVGLAMRGNELNDFAYVASSLLPNVRYSGAPIRLGPAGVQRVLPLPELSEHEKILVDSAPYYLKDDIKRGEEYADMYLNKSK